MLQKRRELPAHKRHPAREELPVLPLEVLRVKELTAEHGTAYVEKEPTAETEPQLDIEAVTTGETKAEREAFDFLRRRFNRKE